MTFLYCGPCEWSSGWGLLDRDAQRLCFVGQRDHVTAGFAQNVLGHTHTVASGTLVGVHSKAMLADAMHFGIEVANTHFLGFGSCQCLAGLQGLENTERLGFRIDQFHSITFLSKYFAVTYSVL